MTASRAVVRAVLAADVPGLAASVAAQDRAPDEVVEVADVLRAPAGQPGGVDWLWLLDGTAVPAPGALAALLDVAALAPALPAPVLVASNVVDEQGRAVPGLAPWYRRGDTPAALEAFAHRVLPVRTARIASLLVRPAAAEAAARALPHDLPAAAAALAWSALVLRDAPGLLAPASTARALVAGPSVGGALSDDPREDLRAGLALLRTPAWVGVERLWLAGDVAGRGLRAVARRVSARARSRP